jgi:hypothetical protein
MELICVAGVFAKNQIYPLRLNPLSESPESIGCLAEVDEIERDALFLQCHYNRRHFDELRFGSNG